MQLNEIDFGKARPIEGYGPGFFRIGGQVYEGPVLATADQAYDWQGYDDTALLLQLAGQVDVLFIGTGADMAYLPTTFRTILETAGLGLEPMASPAACRTFNVLLSEGRRVAAALMPV